MKVTYKGEPMQAGVFDKDGQHEYFFEDGQEYDLPETHVKEFTDKGLSLESKKEDKKDSSKKEDSK